MSECIEALVKGEKKLNQNVDFYSASMHYTGPAVPQPWVPLEQA